MKKLAGIVWMLLVAIFASSAFAQPMERRAFSQMELDQMVAPIALYPDALLSQILMASTYPRDVYEAASWARVNRVSGQEAVRAVENEPWDASVISLAAFPHVLEMMEQRREWTERLGDAFLAQPEQVMDTVQELRRRAYEAGHLRSTNELYVEREGQHFVLESPPEEVYVPYYDPRVVYGRWWWPGYDPVWWSPWQGYSYAPGWGFGWGSGIYVGTGFFFGGFNWHNRHVHYSHHRPWYWRGGDYHHGNRWSHNRDHRSRDGSRNGRGDWRNRGGDNRQVRDGRGIDRNGDGRADWRDRRDGDGQRQGDGRRDGTRGGRGGGGQASTGGALGGAAQVQSGGFFVCPAPAQAAARNERVQAQERFQQRGERVYREQPQQQQLAGPRSVHVPSASVGPAPQRSAPAQPHVSPVPQARSAPAPERAAAVQPRAAPQVREAPEVRAAPAPQQRAAPERSAPDRSERAERSAPQERLGGASRVR